MQAIVKIYPSSFSQLVEGLDAIFQRPMAASSRHRRRPIPTSWRSTTSGGPGRACRRSRPRPGSISTWATSGCSSFEVGGGGFDWFGHPPANRTLTAYGLMEFQDMAKVHDVDPNLIDRTRKWLLGQQKSDGSWEPEGHSFHGGPSDSSNGRALDLLSTTAYIAWSVFSEHAGEPKAQTSLAYLQDRADAARDDPYVLALVANALLAIKPEGIATQATLDRLESLSGFRRMASSSGGDRTIRLPCRVAPCFSGRARAAASRRPRWRSWRW